MADPIDALLAPPTPTAAAARDVARRWSSPALFAHCLRSWVWARALGETEGRTFDPELLFVAAMLHDLGVTAAFDSHEVPFEAAGGAVAWTFAAGAGWPEHRRSRLADVIERHMWTAVDPELDVEGYLLETATSLDVAGSSPERWDPALLAAVARRLPRRDFTPEFAASIHAQATRKPASTAARLDASGRIPQGGRIWASLAPAGG